MTKTFGKRVTAEPTAEPVKVAAPAAPRPSRELRSSKRTRTLLAGKLCYGAGLSTDCTISDLSDTGAKVRCDNAAIVPASIFLVHLREHRAFEATVAWRRASSLGLKFAAVHDLNNPTTDELKRLRLHCVEFGPRTSVPNN
jgi:hypothetical protein